MTRLKAKYSPMDDRVFQILFGEVKNANITKALVEDILGQKIKRIELDKNKHLLGQQRDDKTGIVDIRAEIDDGVQLDIEMQTADRDNFLKRILLYWARMYVKTMEKGNDYSTLKKCIVIAFVDFEFSELKEYGIHTKWQIKETEFGEKVLTDVLELNIIEVSKVQKEYDKEAIIKWVNFLKNPYGMEVENMAKTDEEIAEARRKLDEINADKELVAILEAQDWARWDYNDMINDEKRKARRAGLAERHRKAVWKNGIKKRSIADC